MPTLIFPKQIKGEIEYWRGISKGSGDKDLYMGFNIDVDKIPGVVMVSDKMYKRFSADDDAQFGFIEAIIRTDVLGTAGIATSDRWWVMAGGRWFSTSTNPGGDITNLADSGITFAENAETSFPTDAQDDAVIFNGALISPSATDLDRYVGTTWTNPWYSTLTGASALTNNPHPLDVFINKLLIGDGRFLNTVDDSSVVQDPAITLPANFQINKIVHNANFAFIGANNTTGQNAVVFAWDGIAPLYESYFELRDRTVLAGTVVGGVPIFANGKGQIELFNGNGFDVVGELPTARERGRHTNLPAEWIHRNGMIPFEDGVLIGVTGEPTFHRFPSGLWYLNLKTGNFYPRFAFTESGTSMGTTSTVHFGAERVSLVGAVADAGRSKGLIAAGCRILTDVSATLNTLQLCGESSTVINHSYFITSISRAKDAVAKWLRLKAQFFEFLDSGARIILKYKIIEAHTDDFPFDNNSDRVDTVTATWASTTTFTAILSTGVAVGDEIVALDGDGSGIIAHITALSATPDSSSVITVTIDETLGTLPTGTATIRIEPWVKLGSISDDDLQEKMYSIIKTKSWIQFKCVLRGGADTSPRLKKLFVEYSEYAR